MATTAPLTKSQYGLYVECAQHPGEAYYNIPYLYTFDGSLDENRLKTAIETAVAAHPTLLTRIELSEQGDPIQTVVDSEKLTLEVEYVTDIRAAIQGFIQPFDIYNDHFFRMRMLRDEEHYYWLLDIHHIIGDGSTLKVLLDDIGAAYDGRELTPETITMAGLALEEEKLRKTARFEEDKQWYAREFDCGDCFSTLFPDLDGTEDADGLETRCMNVDSARVEAFCRQHGIFKSTLFTAAYSFLMAKYNNEQSALFRTVFSGRDDRRTAHTVGMLVKTLPVFAQFTDETTVLDFLKAGQEQMTGCREHSLYAFTDAVSDLNLQMDTYFAWHGFVLDNVEVGGKPVKSEQLCNTTLGVPFYVKALIQDGHYFVKAEYKTNLYSEQLVNQFLECYENVVEGFLTETKLSDILITNTSQQKQLDTFNQTDVDYDDTQTIVSLFRRQAKETPENIAVVYKDKRYTYKEVDEISDRIAGYIASKGLGLENVVSVLIPRCEWMAIASLGVLKAGCAYQPLDPTYPKERLNFMMQDANARLLIADEELRPVVDEYQGEVLLTRDLVKCAAVVLQPTDPRPDSLFILLYTSGSTGVPKGCQLTHGNLVAFCHWYQRYYDLKPEHNVAAYASYGFDACMMDMYPALTCGATLHIIPEEIRLDLIALNDYFERKGITHSFMTTQVAYQFATSIENHSLLHFSCGGEKLASLNPPSDYQFHNIYGPTETTVLVTAYSVQEKKNNIPIGKATDNMRLYIVDPQGHRMPVGAAGELWVSGPQVGRGYLNRSEKTAEVFIPNPFVSIETSKTSYSICYRTGDIVRYLPDGNIEFVGRRDGQVKIRGFRIELKEVESIIRQFPGIKDATVQAFDNPNGGKFVAAYIVGDGQIDIDALNNFILEEKPPYMVPAVTMQIEAIPLNQNQKVNKRALPKPEKEVRGESLEVRDIPMDILDQEIHHIIAGIINTEDFGVTTVLGYAGLTSITAIKLAIQINKRYGITLDSKSLAKTATPLSIKNEILKEMMKASPSPSKGGGGEVINTTDNSASLCNQTSPPLEGLGETVRSAPLSYAQTGVYVDCMKQPTSTVYNVPMCIRLPQGTDVQLLGKSIETVIKSHPQFFVHFDSEDGQIVQIVDTTQPVKVKQYTLSTADLEQFKKEFVKPFNLRQGPLYRMEIVSCGQDVFLFADTHHLIMDGGSFDLFLNQLCDLMNGGEIEAEVIRYVDFVADEKAAEGSASYLEAQTFFQERLSSIEGVTEVLADLTNPLESGSPSEVFCPLDFSAIEAFCKQHNLSPAHLTLAAVFYTLSRFTNNEQICITTISNGRSDLRIRNTVGMFVNTLAMSAEIGEQTVMDFLTETGTNFDKTLTHEKYPFAQIAADYDLSAEILFAYQMGVIDQHHINGQKLDIEVLKLDAVKTRIAFHIQEQDGVPGVLIEYDNGRYSQELMLSLGHSIGNAVNAFIRQPEAMLKNISLLDKKQTALLDSFNDTEVPYDTTQTVVSLFRRQVKATPDNIAVVYKDKRYTYKEVDEISGCIAGYIASKGVGAEDVVSIIIPRCEWMVIASLGVLKAGCAYQPLDPSYPAERLNFMIKDADAKMLIADELLRNIVDEYDGEVLLTKDILSLSATESQPAGPQPADLFILLYTSGSTGVPKGVMLEHRNVAAFCTMHQLTNRLDQHSHVGAYASFGFDACLQELWAPLTIGATVYILPEEMRLDLVALSDYFEQNAITHGFMTTQVARQFVNDMEHPSLKVFGTGGEKLADITPPTYLMLNGYGPTESICYVTAYAVRDKRKSIPIGKAVANMRLYIVDSQGHRLPVGAAGELWVSGPQVSRGYLNQPEKTAETFIDTPWGRCYRTGDIVRYLPDGNIEFVGRRDGQVKIRGFRIELKEVESVIRQYPSIKDVTVQAFDHPNGGKFIAAYIVSDATIDIKELNAFIGKQKPPYMIPAATMQIDSIPLNQNQKVNRKALPTPVMQVADREYVEPVGEVEKRFCKIFADILSVDGIGATDNFFEMGGTSLTVMRVIIEADKMGYHIAYGDVFANPTPRLLERFFSDGTTEEDEAARNYNYGAVNTLLKGNTLDAFRQGDSQPLGNVLLTGATGFLGIHILKELIDRDDVPVIWCLVRGENEEKAEGRLKTLMFYYFNKNYSPLVGSRIRVLNGDVTQDFQVPGKVDTVFNCAAVVKHFSKGTEIEDVNVGGALRCVSFCLRNNARLIHVSTYSTAGMSVDGMPAEDSVFTEQMLYFGQNLGNQYIHSKFMSERIVLDAVALHRLNAKVMRVGNLAPRTTDGEFQINFQTNSAMGRIRVYQMLGCYPYSLNDAPMEFSPINEVARAIVLLSETPKACCVFHPYNNHVVHFGDVLQELSKVTDGPRQVEEDEFNRLMETAKQDPEKVKRLSSLLAYQDMAHGRKVVSIPSDNDYTTQVLYRLGFRWSTTSWDYVERMLTAIGGFGFFEA